MVHLIRRFRPHKVIGFDLEGRFEENMDHVKCAQALAEACWTSSFDRHDTHHFDEGLAPHAIGERIFFARNPVEVNIHFDISPVIEQKIKAVAAQKTVMKNFFHQMKLRGEANGVTLPFFEGEIDTDFIVDFFMREYFSTVAEPYGCEYAEVFRRERAGLLDPFIPAAEPEEG
jgi:LmbE family N-acetylglucosaminyl deacetylase